MKTGTRITLAATLATMALMVAAGASAHERGRHDGYHGYGRWHGKPHHHGARHHHHVVCAPVLVYRPAPVYYERRIHHYYAPPPAIVVGVQVPSLLVRLY